MVTDTTRHADGTIDIVQRGAAAGFPAPEQLETIYWHELARATLGLTRFSRDAVRVLGIWPVLLRFSPASEGRRAICGGIFARKPHGSIRWEAAGGEIVVAVERFAPLLRGPLWRFEAWLHDLVGRRYLATAAKAGD